MKLTTFIILAVCLHTSANTRAQQTVTFSGKEVSLENVFNAIKKQTSYRFFFNTDAIQHASKVSIDVKNAPIEQVMTLALKDQQLTYAIKGRTIFIMKKQEEQKASSQQMPPSGDPVTVSGRVTDENGAPAQGVNVVVKGTSKGTTTNLRGEFEIKDVNEGAVLLITSVGYDRQEILVNKKAFITAQLKVAVGNLDEMQVIAYGATSKRLNTGSVSTVKSLDIEKQPVSNPLLALQGRIPGMEISQINGVPGGAIKVQIRGLNSIQNGNQPLYIIDGVPYISDNLVNLGGTILGGVGSTGGSALNYINPTDIEAINVLKDADATAIYGSRGANGVILITTKKGSSGKLKIDINAQTGWGKVSHFVDMLDKRQYLNMRYEALSNDGVDINTLAPTNSKYYDLKVWDTTRFTDWQKVLIGNTAHYNDLNTSFSGGSNNTQYLISAGYHKETTVFPGDFNNQRGSLHFNLNSTSIDKKFHFLFSANYSANNNHILTSDLTTTALNLSPVAPPIYNPDGTYNWAKSTWNNPIAAYLNRKYNSETNNLVGNAILSYQIFNGLEIKSSFGYTSIQTYDNTLNPAGSKDPALWASYGTGLRSASFLNNRFTSWIIEPQLVYSKEIIRGTFSALIGTTIHKNKTNGQREDTQGYNSDLVMEDPKAASLISAGSTIFSIYKYNAIFGRIGYNWQEKYLLNLTARRDGTSRFGPENKFHNFGAIGMAWIFSKERFIEKNLSFLSFGKIRGSYGTTGNDNVGDYSYLDLYTPLNVGMAFQGVPGVQLNRLYTPNLQWEETKKLETGLELGFLNDRIVLTVNRYYNTSSNELVYYTLPSTAGFVTILKNLPAKVDNKGWEFSINTVNINTKGIRWSSSLNFSRNRNILATVSPGMISYYNSILGKSLTSLNLYPFADVNQSTGQYEFYDKDGNITNTPSSFVYIDGSTKFFGGFQNSIQFKSFQLDIFLHFVKQNGLDYLYNYVPGSFGTELGNQPKTVLSRWQKPGDVTSIQKFNQNGNLSSSYVYASYSDQLWKDASFIRLKNVSLSWQIPKSWKDRTHLQNGKLFIQGQNLWTFTKYHGTDPETLSSTSLPTLRVIVIGIQAAL